MLRATFGGRLIALLALSACFSAPGTTSMRTARAQFAERAYCPLRRVWAHPVGEAVPPKDVADDPERLALWKTVAHRRARDRLEWRVRVEGCDQHSDFLCSDGASCVESASTMRPEAYEP